MFRQNLLTSRLVVISLFPKTISTDFILNCDSKHFKYKNSKQLNISGRDSLQNLKQMEKIAHAWIRSVSEEYMKRTKVIKPFNIFASIQWKSTTWKRKFKNKSWYGLLHEYWDTILSSAIHTNSSFLNFDFVHLFHHFHRRYSVFRHLNNKYFTQFSFVDI